MNNFFSQLKNETQKIRLSESERSRIRNTLEAAMLERRGTHSARFPRRASPTFFLPFLAPSLAFTLILALVGGSTTYAAEGAMPGDLLYPVKIHVNEKVVAALAVTPEARASVHTDLTERRIEEAESLAARGALTSERKEELETNLDVHASVVEEVVAEIEVDDPVFAADISRRLESSLSAHSAVLARLGGRGESEESRNESEKFAHGLWERGQRFARADAGFSVKAERAADTMAMQAFSQEADSEIIAIAVVLDSDDAVATRLEANASTTLDEAETEFASFRASLDATTSARVSAQFRSIRSYLENFRKERVSGSWDKSRLEKAFKDAVTMKAFIKAQKKFQEHSILPATGVSTNGEDGGEGDEWDEGDRKNEDEGENEDRSEGGSGDDENEEGRSDENQGPGDLDIDLSL